MISYDKSPPIAYDLRDALLRKGLDVELFLASDYDNAFYNRTFKTINRIVRNFRVVRKGFDVFSKHPKSRLNVLTANYKLMYEYFRPDYALFIHGDAFGNNMLSEIRVPKIAWWIEHDDTPIERVKGFATPFDIYASIATNVAEQLKECGFQTTYLCHAFDPRRFYPIPDAALVYDVAFVGNWSPWRESVIARLLDITKNIALIGPNWRKKGGLLKKKMDSIYKGEWIAGRELNALYNASRIVLNAARVLGSSGLNMRFFEVPATKACLLTDATTELGLHFKNGEHLAVYDSLDELERRVVFLLNGNSTREHIRHMGYQNVIANYTYDHLAAQIMDLFDKIRN